MSSISVCTPVYNRLHDVSHTSTGTLPIQPSAGWSRAPFLRSGQHAWEYPGRKMVELYTPISPREKRWSGMARGTSSIIFRLQRLILGWEMRLRSVRPLLILLPPSILAFGWTTHYHTHIAGPVIALFFSGFSILWVTVACISVADD